MDELTCGICGQQFATPAALGSHQRYTHGIVSPYRKTVENQAKDSARKMVESVLKCPDCQGPLELMRDGPGIYKLRCQSCYDSE